MALRIPLYVARGLFLILWTVFWISLSGVAALLTLSRDLPLVLARRAWAPGILWGAGVQLELDALPELAWSEPHIFIMNHQSMMDIPVAFLALPANLRFVAKHSLAHVPFLGWYMLLTGMIFINRSDRRAAVRSLKRAGERIRQGSNIIAYPEGTRSPDGRILPFKKGAFALAMEAQVPVVPVAIEGTGRALSPGSYALKGGRVRMKVGHPIGTAGRQGDKAREELLHEVREALVRLHAEIGGEPGKVRPVAAMGDEGLHA